MFKPADEQLKVILRGVSEIISEEALRAKLQAGIKENRPLLIKAGFDPTSSDLHLGHTVLLEKMRHFQEFGHKAVFLIGDYTALIGDPSGQTQARKMLTPKIIKDNLKSYLQQAGKILLTDKKVFEVRRNSEWFGGMSVLDFMSLAARSTIARIIERDDFSKRLKDNKPVSLLEAFYPLMQGYDSVVLKADVELGGVDQKFNLLMGRELQRDYKQEPQAVLMMPLLEGLDGVQKMSKSFGNYVGIDEPASEMFGKIMSVSDELMMRYFELLTSHDMTNVRKMHPKEAKELLASSIVAKYHGKDASAVALDEFRNVFSSKNLPSDLPEYVLSSSMPVLKVLTASGLAKSGNEARRLISQGGVAFDENKITDEAFLIDKQGILKVGSRRFLRIVMK